MQCDKTNFQEFTNVESDGLQIQAKFHIIMSDVVDDKEDHNFDSEHVEKHIGMSKAEYEEGEHSITKNVLKQINLWSKSGRNESDKAKSSSHLGAGAGGPNNDAGQWQGKASAGAGEEARKVGLEVDADKSGVRVHAQDVGGCEGEAASMHQNGVDYGAGGNGRQQGAGAGAGGPNNDAGQWQGKARAGAGEEARKVGLEADADRSGVRAHAQDVGGCEGEAASLHQNGVDYGAGGNGRQQGAGAGAGGPNNDAGQWQGKARAGAGEEARKVGLEADADRSGVRAHAQDVGGCEGEAASLHQNGVDYGVGGNGRQQGAACERLRDAYEDEFKMESSDDDDNDECVYMLPLSHEMGIPKMEEKEVQKEVGKRSLEEPLDTPILPLECAHEVEVEVEVEVEHPLIKFMRVMSCTYEKSDLLCEKKHVIYNNVVCHDIQSRFEASDVEMNEEEDVIQLFLDEAKFHIIMSDVVDDKEDHHFDSEHVEKHIGMSKAVYEEGEHAITKNVLKRINLWTKSGRNESDKDKDKQEVEKDHGVDATLQVYSPILAEFEAIVATKPEQSMGDFVVAELEYLFGKEKLDQR
ncbi:hypothetical protein L7F22_001105 [Adiantum nelumboides]|nr:hypothetical protein [Adiantum nelumboides]